MVEAMRRSGDPLLLDRIPLEFAELCSQVFSAEGISENTAEALENAVRKAAGYVRMVGGLSGGAGGISPVASRFCGKTPSRPFSLGLQAWPSK